MVRGVVDVAVKPARLVNPPHGCCGDPKLQLHVEYLAVEGLPLDVGSPHSLCPVGEMECVTVVVVAVLFVLFSSSFHHSLCYCLVI